MTRQSAGQKRGQKCGSRMKTRVKTAKGRKLSSTRWLQRQLNDPYVAAAQKDGYRSRAAYKIIEIDDRFNFLKPQARIIDLGSAPGGWAQVAAHRIGGGGSVTAIDMQAMEALAGVTFCQLDFMDDTALPIIENLVGGSVDFVMSDMAAPVTGHRQTDHLRTIVLVEAAAYFAFQILEPGGSFCAKVFQGGTSGDILRELKSRFDKVHHIKPKASRKESAELYVVALGFKGDSAPPPPL